jgi:hypothetical protein
MPVWGWEAVETPFDEEGLLRHQRAFLKNDAVLFLDADTSGGATELQVVEMGSRGALEVQVGVR